MINISIETSYDYLKAIRPVKPISSESSKESGDYKEQGQPFRNMLHEEYKIISATKAAMAYKKYMSEHAAQILMPHH